MQFWRLFSDSRNFYPMRFPIIWHRKIANLKKKWLLRCFIIHNHHQVHKYLIHIILTVDKDVHNPTIYPIIPFALSEACNSGTLTMDWEDSVTPISRVQFIGWFTGKWKKQATLLTRKKISQYLIPMLENIKTWILHWPTIIQTLHQSMAFQPKEIITICK